jgi:predicted DNA-binding ribbon-helix-helix protein
MLRKRSLSLAGHTTSLALEPAFWDVLGAMAGERRRSLTSVIAEIDAGRGGEPLASACRVAALAWAGRTTT